MRFNRFIAVLAICLCTMSVSAQDKVSADTTATTSDKEAKAEKKAKRKEEVKQHIQEHYKFYGFIRNFFTVDTRENKAGSFDLFYYLPKDVDLNEYGDDLNQQTSFRYLALTTRLGVDVQQYKYKSTEFGAKIEADFYCTNAGGNVATLRLRHAYATTAWSNLPIAGGKTARVCMTYGQTWHPISTGAPDDISFELGAPFNAYNRSPQITMDATFDKKYVITASLLYQMQYRSTGPNGTSGDYIKYGCTPEAFLAFTYKNKGFMGRVGVDVLSIKPRNTGVDAAGVTVKVSDRITTATPYIYLEYKYKDLTLKGKSVYSSAGEHIYMMSGYAVSDKDFEDGHYEYTPLHCSSSWITILYGQKVQGALFAGYIENLGTYKPITSENDLYFNSNGFPNLNRMYRIVPSIRYNLWKFTLALQYHFTSVQYGDKSLGINLDNAKYDQGLHWVSNHRVEAMIKFSF